MILKLTAEKRKSRSFSLSMSLHCSFVKIGLKKKCLVFKCKSSIILYWSIFPLSHAGVYRLSHKDKRLFLGSESEPGHSRLLTNGKCLHSNTALTDKGQERDLSTLIIIPHNAIAAKVYNSVTHYNAIQYNALQ